MEPENQSGNRKETSVGNSGSTTLIDVPEEIDFSNLQIEYKGIDKNLIKANQVYAGAVVRFETIYSQSTSSQIKECLAVLRLKLFQLTISIRNSDERWYEGNIIEFHYVMKSMHDICEQKKVDIDNPLHTMSDETMRERYAFTLKDKKNLAKPFEEEFTLITARLRNRKIPIDTYLNNNQERLVREKWRQTNYLRYVLHEAAEAGSEIIYSQWNLYFHPIQSTKEMFNITRYCIFNPFQAGRLMRLQIYQRPWKFAFSIAGTYAMQYAINKGTSFAVEKTGIKQKINQLNMWGENKKLQIDDLNKTASSIADNIDTLNKNISQNSEKIKEFANQFKSIPNIDCLVPFEEMEAFMYYCYSKYNNAQRSIQDLKNQISEYSNWKNELISTLQNTEQVLKTNQSKLDFLLNEARLLQKGVNTIENIKEGTKVVMGAKAISDQILGYGGAFIYSFTSVSLRTAMLEFCELMRTAHNLLTRQENQAQRSLNSLTP